LTACLQMNFSNCEVHNVQTLLTSGECDGDATVSTEGTVNDFGSSHDNFPLLVPGTGTPQRTPVPVPVTKIPGLTRPQCVHFRRK